MRTARITADAAIATLSLAFEGTGLTASTLTRTLAGDVVRYGAYGRTSVGRLRVRAGALRFPTDVTRVKLTREHDRNESRGYVSNVVDDGQVLRIAARVSDGPEGDAALREATDRTRDGFSFDVVDARIEGDELVDAVVVAIGQVGIPAFDDSRIDTVAAAHTDPAEPVGTTEENRMTAAQRARLAELRALQSRTAEQETELQTLVALEASNTATATPAPAAPAPAAPAAAAAPAAEPVAVAASLSAVPAGVPTPSPSPATTSQTGALDTFVSTIVAALSPGGGGAAAITAALTDVTHAAHTENIEAPAWSGELWSGVQYEAEFTNLFNSGSLTNWEGQGWRFVQKPEMQDYAGNKAAIPSGPVTTEPTSYEAARMAVGHDIDRKFYDFPNEAFLRAYVEAVRESWAIKLDDKVRTYALSHAVAVTGPDGADVGTDPDPVVEPSVFRAVARLALALKRRRVGRMSFVVMNDEDWFSLFDVTADTKPAFLDLFGIDPGKFIYSDQVPQGTIVGGVKQAATVRTLPGSPIRVSAQHLANGGIDEAFFGYWAIEEHHESGIASVEFTPA